MGLVEALLLDRVQGIVPCVREIGPRPHMGQNQTGSGKSSEEVVMGYFIITLVFLGCVGFMYGLYRLPPS